MRMLDKFISFIFSIIILVVSVVVLMLVFDLTSFDLIVDLVNTYVLNDAYRNTVILITAIFILLSLKTTIFLSDISGSSKRPILVDTDNGRVEIAQETIDTTVKSVAYSFPEIKNVQAKMEKQNKGIVIYVAISVIQDTNIKSLTDKLQAKIGTTILDTTGIKVLNTNVKVKNICEKNKKVETEELISQDDTVMSQDKIEVPKEDSNVVMKKENVEKEGDTTENKKENISKEDVEKTVE